jgi:hypothetical protein
VRTLVGLVVDERVQGGILGQAENVLNAVPLAPLHGLPPAIVAVATNGDDGVGPVHPDAVHETAQMGSHLLAAGSLAGAQDGDNAMAGGRVIDMDGLEAPLIVMGVEQRQLLMAMHDIGGVVEIEGDGIWRTVVTSAPQVHRGVPQSDQRAQVRRVLPARHRRL